MDQRPSARTITAAQVVAVLTSTLALFFIAAFVAKSFDAYRLKNWRDRLRAEIEEMIRQRMTLEEEVQRRASQAWLEEALRDAGQVSEGMVGVTIVTATPGPALSPTPTSTPPVPLSSVSKKSLLGGPYWRAWMRLLWGFD